jgi:hypothetical protein
MPPLVFTAYDNGRWQIVSRIVDSRFVDVYGVSRYAVRQIGTGPRRSAGGVSFMTRRADSSLPTTGARGCLTHVRRYTRLAAESAVVAAHHRWRLRRMPLLISWGTAPGETLELVFVFFTFMGTLAILVGLGAWWQR